MVRARNNGNWWAIPLALVVGATLIFLAFAATRWTHRPGVPTAISVRPDAHATPSPSPHPKRNHHHENHHHHGTPKPTATVTVTSTPRPTVPVTVVTPKQHVVTAKPSDDNHQGDGYGGGSDDRHDDGKGKHGRDD
jgi:hypothetical protein